MNCTLMVFTEKLPGRELTVPVLETIFEAALTSWATPVRRDGE